MGLSIELNGAGISLHHLFTLHKVYTNRGSEWETLDLDYLVLYLAILPVKLHKQLGSAIVSFRQHCSDVLPTF